MKNFLKVGLVCVAFMTTAYASDRCYIEKLNYNTCANACAYGGKCYFGKGAKAHTGKKACEVLPQAKALLESCQARYQ